MLYTVIFIVRRELPIDVSRAFFYNYYLMTSRFKVITAVHIVIIEDEKLLLHRRFHTGWKDGWWHLPAGHIEDNESASVAAARELKEEIGISLTPEQLKPVHIMHRKGDDIRLDTFWSPRAKLTQVPINAEPEKCDGIEWFALDSLPEKTIPYAIYAVDQIRKGNLYSEFGWE